MEMNDKRLKELVNPVCEIAKQAGAEIMKIYSEGFEIQEKNDHSPLTTADLASHTLIINKLKALTPDIPILSEESTSISFSERSSWKSYWLIDPLDGTREFRTVIFSAASLPTCLYAPLFLDAKYVISCTGI